MSQVEKTKKLKAIRRPRQLGLGPSTFYHFPRLPPEVRIMIWEIQLPDAQLVRIGGEPRLNPVTKKYEPKKPAEAYYKIPILLRISRETREFIKRYYRYLYARRLGGFGIWMSSQDILFFDSVAPCASFFGTKMSDLDGIRHANRVPRQPLESPVGALAFRDFPYRFFPETFSVLEKMGRPKQIFLLRQSGRVGWREGGMQASIDRSWVANAADTKLVGYEKPEVRCLTYKSMREHMMEVNLHRPDCITRAKNPILSPKERKVLVGRLMLAGFFRQSTKSTYTIVYYDREPDEELRSVPMFFNFDRAELLYMLKQAGGLTWDTPKKTSPFWSYILGPSGKACT